MMDYIKFEALLGKHISTVEDSIGSDFENTLFQKDFYYITDELVKKDFFGMKYNMLYIKTNDKDAVEAISILFQKVITRQFYDTFVKEYGEPIHTQVITKRKEVIEKQEKTDSDFASNAKKYEIELREGTFEENPLYIIWKKEGYEIKAFLRHEQNISEVTFSMQQ